MPWEGERPVDDRASHFAVRDLNNVDLSDDGVLLDRTAATVRPDAPVADVKRLLRKLDGIPVHVTTTTGRWLGQISPESMRPR